MGADVLSLVTGWGGDKHYASSKETFLEFRMDVVFTVTHKKHFPVGSELTALRQKISKTNTDA